MSNNNPIKPLINGIFTENPTFVLMLGMCPTLAVTTSAINGLGMGLSTTAVLVLSNLLISMLRKVIPDGVRIPAFIVIIATFVTVVELLIKGYLPSLYASLGIYIPLIVVNCIILGRAEAFASKNKMLHSIFDGLGMGLGFTLGLTLIGIVRELLGTGAVFNVRVLPEAYEPLTIFILAPGAFFVLAALTACMNKIKLRKGVSTGKTGDCDKLCKLCSNTGCTGRLFSVPAKESAPVKVPAKEKVPVKEKAPASDAAKGGDK